MTTEPYPIRAAEYITDDLVQDICAYTVSSPDNPSPCSWDAVDPLHQTMMGSRMHAMLRNALPVLMAHGWQPPMPEYSKVHPRGRLRDVLNEQFQPQFGAVGRSVPRSVSERVYHWHLGEARAIAHTKVARELNELADLVASTVQPHNGQDPKVAEALTNVEELLRKRADHWEDTMIDPRHSALAGAVK